jgi:pyridoxamine 5'-phosphate oxidase
MELADIRKDYKLAALGEADIDHSPFVQFEKWFAEAVAAKVNEPNAMTLATVNKDGKPAARIVLIKDFDTRGATFFTNYESRKANDLAANDDAALVFFWPELERQVRIEGRVEKVSPAESDAYYAVRPLGSRIGAWASPQSRVIASREALEAAVAAETAARGMQPSRPAHWGGYRVMPTLFEFWQGRASRLHDRLCYQLNKDKGETWQVVRLAP